MKRLFCGVLATFFMANLAQATDIKDFFSNNKFIAALHERGIYFSSHYTGQGGTNAHGGQRPHHSAYNDQTIQSLTLDTEKLMGLKGGWLQTVCTNRHGHSVAGRYINTFSATQALYGDGQTWRLTQFTYMQTFANNKVNIRFGRENATNSYFMSPLYYNFQNIGNYVFPLIIATNTNPSAFPLPSWGTRVRIHFTDNLALTTGVYQAVGADYLNHSRHGFNWGSHYDEGMWLPAELKYQTYKTSAYPMMLAAGVVHDTGNGRDLKGNKYKSRTLLWFQGEKTVWKPDPTGERGITVFGAAGFGTSEKQTFKNQFMGGFVWKGPAAVRADDVLSFQALTMRRTKNNRNQVSERHPNHTVLEVNYAVHVVPGLVVTPDFQYIIHPDGMGQSTQILAPANGRIKNAIYLGTQVSYTFNDFFGIKNAKVPD